MKKLIVGLIIESVACIGFGTTQAATFAVSVSPDHAREPLNGRLLLLLSVDASKEPRQQIEVGTKSQQVFGVDAANWKGSERLVFDAKVLGYPRLSLADIPAGTYRAKGRTGASRPEICTAPCRRSSSIRRTRRRSPSCSTRSSSRSNRPRIRSG